MLQIRLLGQFDVRLSGKRIVISSRAGQSLLAYLAMTAGTPHRREKLAGTLWPESSEENARKNLRQELWRIRKAIPNPGPSVENDYLLSDEYTITFNREADYWLDVAMLERPDVDPQSLTSSLSLYQGELLPGFYDDWVIFERERIQNLFESKMERLVEKLVEAERWAAVQEQCEHWLALGSAPEPAYRAMMLSHSARGDMAKVSAVYQRCVDDLRDRFDVEPSAETHALYNGLLKGARAPRRILPAQPSGTVTFLFTDIEGSTRLLDKLGDQYANALAEHHRILRSAIQKWRGTEIDTQGDAFFVTFTRALDALQCAAEAQRVLAGHSWPFDEPVRVRMGLHTGEPLIASTGYVGMDVHRAARIGDAGHGGQILLSQTTRDLVIQDLPLGLTIRDLGEHRLKDMKYPTPIYQLVIEGLQTSFPPLKTKFTGSEAPTPGEPPFKGLQYFEESDSDRFFGRELLTAKLVGRLRETQFLSIIIGASGSGKSSLVRAGLIPALKRGAALFDGTRPPSGSTDWKVHIVTPTAHPLEALATELTRDLDSVTAAARLIDDLSQEPRSLALFLARADPKCHTVLVIDQFEELFTLCRDEFEREAFIDNLLNLISPEQSEATLIITLRADFYAHLAQYPELRDAVAQQQEYIGPMTVEELRRAIEEPAKRGHWEFEPGLVDLILRDVGDEPGALPLLSHALLETWKRRAGHTLTLKGYADAGGVHGAIAHTAESVYQDLSAEEKELARNIFLRLTELGEGTEDTRRRVSFAELMASTENTHEVRSVLNILADARLITLGEETAEVAHEALIREWPTLREWLNQDREGLRLHRHLTEAAHDWEILGRDPGALYRGAHLAQAREWAALHPKALNEGEHSFLNASIEQEQREAREREVQYQRELDNARKLAEAERQRAEIESQRAAELQIINSVQEALASKLEMQAIYDLVGDKIREIFDAQGTAIFIFDYETGISHNPYCFLEERFPNGAEPISGFAKRMIDTAQTIEWKTNEEFRSLGGSNKNTWGGKKFQSGMYVPLMIGKTVKGMVGITNLHQEHAYNDSHVRLLQTLSNSMSVALENAHLFDETERLFKETKQRAEEQANLANRLRIRNRVITIVGSLAVILALLAGLFGAQSNHNAVQAEANFANAEAQRLAALANSLVLAEGNSELIALLSLRSMNTQYSPQGDVALSSAARLFYARQLFSGHTDRVYCVAYSPDGKYIVTTSGDQTARLWDAATGKEVRQLIGHTEAVFGVAFSPDGKYIFTRSGDSTARLWDAATGHEVRQFSPLDGIGFVAFSPDGKYVLTGGADKIARMWAVSTGKVVREFIGHTDQVKGVDFSPDGKYVLTGSWDKTAWLWDAATGQVLRKFTGPTSTVVDVAFSPNGKYVYAGTNDGIHWLWDVQTGQELYQVESGWMAFSHNGKFLAAGSGNIVRLLDMPTGQELHRYSGHTATISALTFSPDDRYLVSGSYDGTARLWDTEPSAELPSFDHTSPVPAVAFSPDGKYILTGGIDGITRLWDAVTGEELRDFMGHTDVINFGAVFSSDGKYILTGSWDKTMRLWDMATGEELHQFHVTGMVNSVAFSPDGAYVLAGSSDRMAWLWNTETSEELRQFVASSSGTYGLYGVSRVVFSPDGKYIATSAEDGTARLWDAQTGQELHKFVGHTGFVHSVVFSADGKYLLTGGEDRTARLWDIETGEEIRQFTGHTDGIYSAAFSPEGEYVATASIDSTARLWDAQTGQELRRFVGHTAAVENVVFSPDGKYLLTGSDDGTARLWDVDYHTTMEYLCSRLLRDFTAEERAQYGISDDAPTCPAKP